MDARFRGHDRITQVRLDKGELMQLQLNDLKKGQKAQIEHINESNLNGHSLLPCGELERRLLEMGFSEGLPVTLMHEGPFGKDPIVVMLDEPFSNLDPDMRSRMRYEVQQILRRIGTTAVLVTHDHEEAFAMADQIAVLNGGG